MSRVIMLTAFALTLSCVCAKTQKLLHRFPTGGAYYLASGEANGDGVPDVAIGLYSKTERKVIVLSGADWKPLFSRSRTPNSAYGQTVAFADLTGDGIDELFLGMMDGNKNGKDCGTVVILRGDSRFPYQFEHGRFHGDRGGDLFGAQVVSIGDLNRDGVPEFVVGASGYCNRSSYVRVFSGKNLAPMKTLTSPRGCTYYGAHVDRAGDVNSDGTNDFVVGANEHSIPGPGFVHVISGKDFSIIRQHQGGKLRDHFGTGLAGPGDVDRDGYADVLIGASEHEIGGRGYARVFSGKTGRALASFQGKTKGDYFGDKVARCEDLNGDGHPDYAIAAPSSRAGQGWVGIYSGRNGVLLHVLTGTGSERSFGGAVVAGGIANAKPRLLVASDAALYVYEFSPGCVKSIGAGCRGSNGVPALSTGTGKAPHPGLDYEFVLGNVPKHPAAFLLVGHSDQRFGPFRLPLALGSIGMTGCQLRTSILLMSPMTGTSTTLNTRLRIPQALGLTFYTQALLLDRTANSFGLTLSNALRLKT